MKPTLIAVCSLLLASCQTIRVNGVEIDRETQAFGIFSAAVIAGMIYSLEHEQDAESDEKCATFVSVPTDKGGFICAE